MRGKAVPLPAPCRFAKPAASFLSMALLSCQLSHAATAYIRPIDFQPNCDIGRLRLTQSQHYELRKIRTAFKMAGDRARLKVMHSEHSGHRSVVDFTSSDVFNRNEARDYVESRFLSGMDFAVDGLEINTGSSISSHRNRRNVSFFSAWCYPRNVYNARCFGSMPFIAGNLKRGSSRRADPRLRPLQCLHLFGFIIRHAEIFQPILHCRRIIVLIEWI